LNATVSSVPTDVASSSSVALPTSCVMAVRRSVSAAHLQAHRGGVLGQDLHAADGLEQRLALDGERVGVAGGMSWR
jgi:hypothetical protein